MDGYRLFMGCCEQAVAPQTDSFDNAVSWGEHHTSNGTAQGVLVSYCGTKQTSDGCSSTTAGRRQEEAGEPANAPVLHLAVLQQFQLFLAPTWPALWSYVAVSVRSGKQLAAGVHMHLSHCLYYSSGEGNVVGSC